ncbi:MAG: Cell death protease [Chaenotheca gracillima]|nr:MAG: Cell death protease [Chaenotheca gracillima]
MRFFTSFPPSRRKDTTMLSAAALWTVLSLLLCSVQTLAEKSAGDYYVHSLPGAPKGPLLKMHAGHIEVNPEHNGNLFFWHFQNRHIANRQRTVIWLNGGPGCSSMDGALMEVGPYRVGKDGNLRYNDGSWDEFANILFVDNPVGTGFSYVSTDSYVHELKEMADQFVVFLEKFFTLFPEYEHDDLYIAGESYAGQHIPYIAQAILDRNNGPNVKHKWMLEGLLIGNGWIAPTEQYMSYLPFAYKEGLIKGGSDAAKEIEANQAICTSKLSEGGKDHVDTNACEQILSSVLKLSLNENPKNKNDKCYNMYDVRLHDSYPSCGMNWPPDLEQVTPYLRRDDVVKALHVNGDKRSGWNECTGEVGHQFNAATSKPSIDMLPSLLEQVPILLFSGAKDLICNHIGTEEFIHNMKWNGGKGFETTPGNWAPRRSWTFEGEDAGIYQEARNLTYVLFYNSSHMVPFDYPRRTRDMLDRFIGVDIASIGGSPADSRIDGEKAGLETSVGGHPNSTLAQENEHKKLHDATKHAYMTAAEVGFVVGLLVLAAFGGYFFYIKQQHRRKHDLLGYRGLRGGESSGELNGNGRPGGDMSTGSRANGVGGALEAFRHKRHQGDLEAADFDESELDNLRARNDGEKDEEEEAGSSGANGAGSSALQKEPEEGDMGKERYSIGSEGSGRSSLGGR